MALNKDPIFFYLGLAMAIVGFGGFFAIMILWRARESQPTSNSIFIKGHGIEGFEFEDNQSSALTFADIEKAKSVSAKRNLHNPK